MKKILVAALAALAVDGGGVHMSERSTADP
jgi:hypothetical protein